MNDIELFAQALDKCRDLPPEVTSGLAGIRMIKRSTLDEGFFNILESQINLCSRGPEWEQTLKRRRDCLRPFCGQVLLKGRIEVGKDAYWVQVEPQDGRVIYWELYKDWSERI